MKTASLDLENLKSRIRSAFELIVFESWFLPNSRFVALVKLCNFLGIELASACLYPFFFLPRHIKVCTFSVRCNQVTIGS